MLHARLDTDTQGRKPVSRGDSIVYVIDDEADLRESSCFLLATLGLTCIQYPSGQAFLDDLATLEPGCLLLDVVMRSMDGLAVQEELRRGGIDWPVVFMSGQQDVATVVRAAKNGAVEFLEKPFNDEVLLSALHRGFVRLRG
jgi:two-component system response regulator FixJ